jgi:mRNA-degrading endonuclease RelE of RelBE toxin-antitoxin system
MNYELEVSDPLFRIFDKLKKKDPLSSKIIKNKISKILEDPYQFKPLRGNMGGCGECI